MVTMTDEQRYSAVLKELGELLTDKNLTISCQRWQIDELKAKLEAAEKERDEAAAKNACEKVLLLDSEAVNALRNANTTLLECYNRMESRGDCKAYIELLQNAQRAIYAALPINGGAA